MPELPEVETYTRYFRKHALKRRIQRVDVRDERILGTRRPQFVSALRGQSFREVRRHGKNLFADAGKAWLHLHFGMSGDLAFYREAAEEPRFARVVFDFEDGTHLAFEDMRLFGVAAITKSPEQYVEEHQLGPDALDPRLTLPAFRKLVAKRRGAIKAVLMTQEIIAGVGNLYADEALFQGSIHPARATDSLDPADVKIVYAKLRAILKDAVTRHAAGREAPARWLLPNREEGERCPLCGGTIKRSVVFGRTTYFCGKHQQ
jgi:formamidopyrimidine-DNA glycosylase